MEKNRPLRDVLRLRDLRNPYIIAGLAGTIATRAALGSLTAKTIDTVVHNTVLPKPHKTETDYRPGELWHGTGRYRYKDGEVIDVLAGVAETGYILPHLDKFDINRQMVTVSLARSRMYARAYADMHGAGAQEQERYGNSLFWACSFLGSVAVEASRETKVWRPSGYYRMLGHLATANAAEWYKNITRVPDPSVVTVYERGSDIHNNYPVLFGVKGANPTDTSRAVALYEIRTEEPLDLTRDVTHVEVPFYRIDETRGILPGVKILPIEQGEEYSSGYSYTQHMHEIV